MTAPFVNCNLAATNARVALALIRQTRKREEYQDLKPAILIGITVARLDGLHLGVLRLALLSLNCALLEGRSSKDWLHDVCFRDMMGYSFRRCFYVDYKGNRRDPPVS